MNGNIVYGHASEQSFPFEPEDGLALAVHVLGNYFVLLAAWPGGERSGRRLCQAGYNGDRRQQEGHQLVDDKIGHHCWRIAFYLAKLHGKSTERETERKTWMWHCGVNIASYLLSSVIRRLSQALAADSVVSKLFLATTFHYLRLNSHHAKVRYQPAKSIPLPLPRERDGNEPNSRSFTLGQIPIAFNGWWCCDERSECEANYRVKLCSSCYNRTAL